MILLAVGDEFVVNGVLHKVAAVKRNKRTGRYAYTDERGHQHLGEVCFRAVWQTHCEQELADQPLSEFDIQSVVQMISQMLQSEEIELELLSTLNDVQRRQVWDALTVEQKDRLKQVKKQVA